MAVALSYERVCLDGIMSNIKAESISYSPWPGGHATTWIWLLQAPRETRPTITCPISTGAFAITWKQSSTTLVKNVVNFLLGGDNFR